MASEKETNDLQTKFFLDKDEHAFTRDEQTNVVWNEEYVKWLEGKVLKMQKFIDTLDE